MYKTKKLWKWIDEKVIKYSKYLEIVPPVIYYNQKDFVKSIAIFMGYDVNTYIKFIELRYSTADLIGTIFAQAFSHSYDIAIFLNVSIDKTELENTIVHELCHLRYCKVEHGKKFNALITKTIKECKGE